MPIRKKSTKRLGTFVLAHQRAHAWAEKAILYRSAGKVVQAKAAAQKAQRWLREIKLLKARAARGGKHGKPS